MQHTGKPHPRLEIPDHMEVSELRRALYNAKLSLLAIGDAPDDDKPSAHMCGVIARSAMTRITGIEAEAKLRFMEQMRLVDEVLEEIIEEEKEVKRVQFPTGG